jgi:hypothetical protein
MDITQMNKVNWKYVLQLYVEAAANSTGGNSIKESWISWPCGQTCEGCNCLLLSEAQVF